MTCLGFDKKMLMFPDGQQMFKGNSLRGNNLTPPTPPVVYLEKRVPMASTGAVPMSKQRRGSHESGSQFCSVH